MTRLACSSTRYQTCFHRSTPALSDKLHPPAPPGKRDRNDDIKDRAKSRYGHFFSEAELSAFTASSTSLRTPSGVRSFGPISRLSTNSDGAVMTPTDLA